MHRDLSLHWNATETSMNVCVCVCVMTWNWRLNITLHQIIITYIRWVESSRQEMLDGEEVIQYSLVMRWNSYWSAYFWFDFRSICGIEFPGRAMHSASIPYRMVMGRKCEKKFNFNKSWIGNFLFGSYIFHLLFRKIFHFIFKYALMLLSNEKVSTKRIVPCWI